MTSDAQREVSAGSRPAAKAPDSWIPLAAGIGMVAAATFLWLALKVQEQQNIQRDLTTRAQFKLIETRMQLAARVEAVERMADRQGDRARADRSRWQRDAGNYLDDFPAMVGLLWMDASGRVRWALSRHGDETIWQPPLGSGIHRELVMDAARISGEPTMTRPIDLGGGGKGGVVYAPIRRDQAFDGFIVSVICFDEFFNEANSRWSQPDDRRYDVRLKIAGDVVFAQTRDQTSRRQVSAYEFEDLIYGTPWQLGMSPTPQTLARMRSPMPTIAICGGGILGLLLATTLRLAQTARLRAQEAIDARGAAVRAADRSRQIVESSPNAMVMVGRDGRIAMVNEETQRLFGYDRRELIGRLIEDLVPPRCRSAHPRQRQGFFANPSRRAMSDMENIYGLKKDGSEFPCEIGLNPIETEEGLMVLASIMDVTERKRVQHGLESLNAELSSKNEEMEQFTYTVSHDLKSPIVTILGYLGYLHEDIKKGCVEDMLDSIGRVENAAKRMRQTIDDLLELSRVGRVTNEPIDVDVSEMLATLVDAMTLSLEKAGARIDVQPGLPIVRADPVRLREVFDNLLSNALKYGSSEAAPQIEIGGHEADGEVRIFVRDHGPGIPPEYHEKVFGLFQRLTKQREGTGVGLAIVKRILEVHGGRVWIESPICSSKVGGDPAGTAFWLMFPRAPAPVSTAIEKGRERAA